MTERDKDNIADERIVPDKQPPALRDLLATINSSRRQCSLYGADHPNALGAAEELSACLDEFIANFDRATLVFTSAAVIVNENSYGSTPNSQELFQRLRVRGVMALTFLGTASVEQVGALLGFLNAEPSDVRLQGGASGYLRKRGVSRIVAHDAIYGNGTDFEDDADGDVSSRAEWSADSVDRSVSAAIDWLSRQDDGNQQFPRLPITDILSSPDQAAKLIREAVTKLHASRKQESPGEIASEVVHDLKDLADSNREKWDKSAPQIRKAISKLPKGMRPEISGFTEEDEQDDAGPVVPKRAADIGEVEALVAEVLGGTNNPDEGSDLPTPEVFEPLFGARADGLLASWRRELQPGSVMKCSARTLETLMILESRATEHERIAHALAGLVPRALDMRDTASARMIVASLIGEIKHDEPLSWRCTSARAALRGIGSNMLVAVVESALASDDTSARATASALVEKLPDLALELVGLLGSSGAPAFDESLRRGIAASGSDAVGPLGRLLREGTGASRELALETLIDMRAPTAIREIAQAMRGADAGFIVRALNRLPSMHTPQVTEICTSHLAHSSLEVRCAALDGLGELGDESSVPAIAQITLRHRLAEHDCAEKIHAVLALARMDCPQALDCLEKMAKRRPLLGRSRYEIVRLAAERTLYEARARRASAQPRAA